MSFLSIPKDTNRIGELIVAGPSLTLQKRFITHICNEVVITNNNTVFGRSKITDELQLFFYGIGEKEQYLEFAWDLVTPKMLGFVLVFNWFDGNEFSSAQQLLDDLSSQIDCHGIVIGDISEMSLPIDPQIYEQGFTFSPKLWFTLWDSTLKSEAKNVLNILIDSLINHYE
jgi:hypothetical protein